MRVFAEDLARDVKHAVRMLRRTRGFTVAALAVLAVCIGANTAVFSVVNALLLRPLPYPHADRLVQVVTTLRTGYSLDTSIPKFVGWRDGPRSFTGLRSAVDDRATDRIFEALAAFQAADPGVTLMGGDTPEHLSALHVSADYFDVFGARLVLGRVFRSAEDRPNGPHVVVLSHGLWAQRFGRDRRVVGRMLRLGADAYEVVGVLDAGFQPDSTVDVYLPLQPDVFSRDLADVVRVVGRLRPSVAVDEASRYLASLAPMFRDKYPFSMGPWEDFAAIPLRDAMVGDVTPALRMFTGAVVFVLLIGCANVATLLLARGERRRREIATRAALGAGRGRVVRQLLAESTLLAAAGGVLGLGCGVAGVRAIVRAASGTFPAITRVSIDADVVWFTIAASLATGLLFGILPALTASRVDLASAFLAGRTSSESGWRRRRPQALLVVAEMTLAIVLLVGCGLMVRTVAALRSVDRGFDPGRVVTLATPLSGSPIQDSAGIDRALRSARLRIAPMPGVAALAAARALPLEPAFALPFTIDRRPVNAPFEGTVVWRSVSPGYFDVFRIPVLRGRAIEDRDTRDAPAVVLVNAALARKYWQRRDPTGERLTIGTGAGEAFRDVPRQIVGVVADPRDEEANREPPPTVYVPLAQVPDALTARNNRLFPLTWVVRTDVNPRLMTSPLGRAVEAATGGIPVSSVRTMEEILAGPAERARFNATLLSAFAAVAVLLAAIGFYGLMAYSVQQRTQEIGIRIALGAVPRDVRNLILADGLRVAGAGIGFGIVAAAVLTRVMATLVFGIATYDPAVFAGVVVLLGTVALIAALVPAHRATRVSPLDAVRGG